MGRRFISTNGAANQCVFWKSHVMVADSLELFEKGVSCKGNERKVQKTPEGLVGGFQQLDVVRRPCYNSIEEILPVSEMDFVTK